MVISSTQLTRTYLRAMRLLAGLMLAITTSAGVALFFLPRGESMIASPLVVTLVALLMSLWFAVTADRDASRRMEAIKLDFAEDGDLKRLLKGYLVTYLMVLLRLQAITVCGVLTAITGKGPGYAVPFIAIAWLLTARAWPTRHKINLLLTRVGIKS